MVCGRVYGGHQIVLNTQAIALITITQMVLLYLYDL